MDTIDGEAIAQRKPRRDIREAYERVMPKAWGEMPDNFDSKLIRSAIKGVWRKLVGKPCRLKIVVKKVPARWNAWRQYDSKRHEYVIFFHPKHGMKDAVHSITHFIHSRKFPRDRAHCDRHLEMEATAARYCVERFKL